MTAKRILKKTGKILLYILGILLFLIVGVLIFINTNAGKRFVKNKAQAYLQKKLNTKVVIGSVDYSLPKWVELNGVYIEDQHKDTLLYGEQLSVDLDMFKLISGNTYIRKVQMKNIYANIYRNENDTNFNFQFVINAFVANTTAPAAVKDTAALKLTLKKIILDRVRLRFEDRNAGSNMYAYIDTLNTDINIFQPDRLQFDVDKFTSSGVNFSMVTYKQSKSTPKDPTAVSPYVLNLLAGAIDLSAVNISIEDKTTGMLYANNVQHIALDKANINLANGKMSGGKLLLDSSFIRFISPRATTIVDSLVTVAPASNISIALNEVAMKNDRFQFDNNNLPAKEGFDPGHIDMQGIKLNARKIYYSADSTLGSVSQISFKDKSGFILDTTHADVVFTNHGISATALYVKTPQSLIQNSIQISYADLKQLSSNPENSKVAVSLNNTTIAVNDLYMLTPFVKAFMPPAKFQNNVVKLNTEISGSLQELHIPTLQLAGFSGTVINAKAILYNITDGNKLAYDITIFNSSIPRADILKFLPASDQDMTRRIPLSLSFSSHLIGTLKSTSADLDIKSSGLDFAGNADIRNFKDPKNLSYNINVRQARVQKSFITGLVPAGTLPPSLNLPEVITASGTAKGDMNNIQPNLKLGGSYGAVAVNGFVRNFKNPETASYDLHFSTNQFAVGKLIKQDTLIGTLTMAGSAKGKGFNYKTMNAVISADVASVGLKKYNYHNASLTADLANGRVNSYGNVNDSNLRMKYEVRANLAGQYPADVTANVVMDTVQLKKLNLYSDTLNASFTAQIKAGDLNPDRLNFSAVIDSSKFEVKGRHYALDSIVATASTTNGNHDLSLRSPFADATASGRFDYDKVGTSVTQYVNKFYKISDAPLVTVPAQQIAFEGVIKKHPLITDIVEGLDYKDINFKGNFTSTGGDSALNLNATLPYVNYQGQKVSEGVIAIRSINDKINGNINFDTLRSGSNIFYKTNIVANVANDSLGITAVTKDIKNRDRFAAGANIKVQNKTAYVFSLKQRLLLNYQEWAVNPGNEITYSPDGILVKDFAISGDSGRIAAASRQLVLNSPVDLTIENFNIRDIFTLTNSDTLLASGTLNGKMSISEFQKKLPAFTGNMTLSSLQFKQQPIGDLKFTADKKDDNTINATLALSGNGNDVTMDGNYFLNNDQNQFDANLKLNKLNMRTLQSLSAGSLTNTSGNITGALAVNGKFTDPRWNGNISFDTTKFTLAQLGTAYSIDKQTIKLAYPTVSFDQFTVNDVEGHKLMVTGEIKERTVSDYDLDLGINATNFTLVNAPKAINNQVYGFAAIDADIDIKGTAKRPEIEGDLSLNDKSDVTMVLPEANSSKDAAHTVVRFIDRDTFDLPEKVKFTPLNEVQSNFAQFLNYNLNLAVGKKAALTIVIDPSTGDEIKVQGDAQLNVGVDPGGNIVLAGNYELNSGYYILHYQFLEREFALQPGSTIAFSGPPTKAQINISAVYTATTSPKELIGNEIGDVDPKVSNTFNQKIPFKVFLYLKGTIQKPQISFDIQLPDENTQINSQLRTTIENKLAQLRGDEAGTNKQVFALLLLNRFVGEQSADFFKGSGGGSNFSEVARESVSKFLSSALDQIAGDLFKGVDIDLNLNSYQDYSSGDANQKTDLNIAVTKNFLNDRLSVSVGRSFGIEGNDAGSKASQQAANGIIPDVTVNYKLTQDGKYMLRAYKKTAYEVILDGYMVETGVAFIVTMDYDKFKELFRKKSKK